MHCILDLTWCDDDAEDLVQDSFLAATQSCRCHGDVCPLIPYVTAMARRKALNQRRLMRHRNVSWDEDVDACECVAPDLEALIEPLLIRQVFASLPIHTQRILRWNADGFTDREIAGLLGISAESARQRVHRAKQHMRALLQEAGAACAGGARCRPRDVVEPAN